MRVSVAVALAVTCLWAPIVSFLDASAQTAPVAPSSPPLQPSAPRCKQFAESEILSFTGYLAITDQKREEEQVHSEPYMFVFLDTPICFKKSPDDVLSTLEVSAAPRALLGRHVAATGKMIAGDAWMAEISLITFRSEQYPVRIRSGPHCAPACEALLSTLKLVLRSISRSWEFVSLPLV